MLNGRTPSDPCGDYTFMSNIGPKRLIPGCSIVDLVLCSMALSPFVVDGGVLPWPSFSDHFPVFASLSLCPSRVSSPSVTLPTTVLKCNPEWKAHYNHFMSSCSVSLDPNRLIQAILETASLLGMSKTRRASSSQVYSWFNQTCIYFKKCLHGALKVMRKEGFTTESLLNYAFIKQHYRLLVAHSKECYYAALSENIISAPDSTSFWRAVRQLTPSKITSNAALDIVEVNNNFQKLFNSSPIHFLSLY